jgi:hypothetical protein
MNTLMMGPRTRILTITITTMIMFMSSAAAFYVDQRERGSRF